MNLPWRGTQRGSRRSWAGLAGNQTRAGNDQSPGWGSLGIPAPPWQGGGWDGGGAVRVRVGAGMEGGRVGQGRGWDRGGRAGAGAPLEQVLFGESMAGTPCIPHLPTSWCYDPMGPDPAQRGEPQGWLRPLSREPLTLPRGLQPTPSLSQPPHTSTHPPEQHPGLTCRGLESPFPAPQMQCP